MSGQFAPGFTTQEHEITCDHLPVQGTIPPWLSGSLLRNGPAQFAVGQQAYRHWFDGLAMLHRFSFHNGAVSYANKFLQSPNYKKARETGQISYSEFATDPCRSMFKRLASAFSPDEPGSNANVNISKIGESFVALTETPLPIEFNPQTLETMGVLHYADKLAGQTTTAHPHYDAQRKMGVNSLTNFSAKSSYSVYGIKDGETKRTIIGSIPVQEPGYMHSFAMTERYVILVEYPLVVNPLSMLTSGKPFIANYHWKPERGSRFLVIRKSDGELVATYTSEAFFSFHHINAFEQGGDLLVDIAAYPDASLIRQLYMDNLLGPQGGDLAHGEYRRYRLPEGGSTTHYEVLSEESIELPRINYEHNNGQPYRFAYGVSQRKDRPDDFLNQLVKVDVATHSTSIVFEEGMYPGEPVFVVAPDATSEDAGVVLSIVLDAKKGASFLLVLDAASFTELARAEVPQHVPFGFHGIYTRK
ncbi:MAG TPA: carotenoid oxygenase family protein [Ktedonosporobacter sp.]|nr:carotenoid oxygenase family protein [Ktedonosporobacter sp.]